MELKRFISLYSGPTPKMTNTEIKIVYLISVGNNSQEVADELNLSLYTVKFHLQNLYRKFEARDRAHMVAIALRMHYIE